ncbi:metal-sulfur cluster assembly factor [Pseudonocardia halophobica]|uniref:metal-sulfur cluster assembly factor n=1 Tax=Pseudonocardia halophobica TaxID=29401 RepID=UPI003D929889
MPAPSEAEVRDRINTVGDPCSAAHGMPLGLTDMGLVETVAVGDDGAVEVRLRLTSPCCGMVGYFVDEVSRRVGELPGTSAVDVSVDAGLDWTPDMMSDRARATRRAHLTELGIPLLPTPTRGRA